MKGLNLYAGLGGNRRLWKGIEITAVEKNLKIAEQYQRLFPYDKMIIGDAVSYLLEHYIDFDFIWASPPCQSHSKIRFAASKKGDYFPIFPDLKLYSLIIFLRSYAPGKWVVENVEPYYEPLIKPTAKLDRHLFWSNFPIPEKQFEKPEVDHNHVSSKTNRYGFSLENISVGQRKDQIIRNCVNPEIGLYILNCAVGRIPTLEVFTLCSEVTKNEDL